jgi:hypothetical protein
MASSSTITQVFQLVEKLKKLCLLTHSLDCLRNHHRLRCTRLNYHHNNHHLVSSLYIGAPSTRLGRHDHCD